MVPLVSSLIAASVALFIFSATQWITARREQTKLLTGKLEELYLVMTRFVDQLREITHAVDDLTILKDTGIPPAPLKPFQWDDFHQLEMLVALHFPALAKDVAALQNPGLALPRIKIGSSLEEVQIVSEGYLASHLLPKALHLKSRLLKDRDQLTKSLRWSFFDCLFAPIQD